MKNDRILVTGGIDREDSYIEIKSRKNSFKKFPLEDVKRNAFGILNLIRPLSTAQRKRVLEYALKVNQLSEGA